MGCQTCGGSKISTIAYVVVFPDGSESDPLSRTQANALRASSGGRIKAVRVPV